MSDWKRILRGVLGMGATFGALAAVFFSILAAVSAVFFPGAEDDLLFMIVAGTVWATGLALSFSGMLAIAARGRSLDELSIARVAAVGVGSGLALATLLVSATWGDWPNNNWIVPFTFLPMLGAGGGISSLLLARTAGRELTPKSGCRPD
mgnify:CR=1 FL=1|tara:strand:- start:432 stop:881 length:450 start_codon:yes stop_codon:yes gene_type:complete